MTGTARYAAFISYAHADEAVAARLHQALETFAVPKNLGTIDRFGLTPIFRDMAELTAHHSLSEKIRDAVTGSKFLIVLCSPAAKASHWVNEEIRLFRAIHGEGAILTVLTGGTPQTAFPPALLEGGREPLAANLGESRESFRLGVTQLAASMLGVGLDTLVQRDAQRRRRRTQAMTAGSLVFSTVMAGMAITAVSARNAAETSRSEAEKMVEFMLTDLKDDLEPIGKLDILGQVGGRAAAYYDAIPIDQMDDNRLARQARARHLLGQVAIDQGDTDKAELETRAAYDATKEVLRRSPENTDAIFAHAQSAYWMGELANRAEDHPKTLNYWQEYETLGSRLYEMDPKNIKWIMEAAWAQNNLGLHSRVSKDHDKAFMHYAASTELFRRALKYSPDDTDILFELANVLSGASISGVYTGEKNIAKSYRLEQIQIYEKLLSLDSGNYPLRHRLAQSMIAYFQHLEPDESKRIAGLNEVQKELRALIEHDPENAFWRETYQTIKP